MTRFSYGIFSAFFRIHDPRSNSWISSGQKKKIWIARIAASYRPIQPSGLLSGWRFVVPRRVGENVEGPKSVSYFWAGLCTSFFYSHGVRHKSTSEETGLRVKKPPVRGGFFTRRLTVVSNQCFLIQKKWVARSWGMHSEESSKKYVRSTYFLLDSSSWLRPNNSQLTFCSWKNSWLVEFSNNLQYLYPRRQICDFRELVTKVEIQNMLFES